MTITTIIIHNSICLVNENQGSSFALPAHGWVGARATSFLAAHFALQNTLSKPAEKKAGPSEGEAAGRSVKVRNQDFRQKKFGF